MRTAAAVSVVVAFVVAGMVYERVSEKRSENRFPRVGRAVDIGGRSLNLFCSGTGHPVVIFESGGGLPGYSWVSIQRQIARRSAACWYDRAGYGWSDPAPGPTTSADTARDLHQLLRNAGMRPPFVLVGHSIGGFHARVYTGMYPNDVAGLVFVDASHEDIDARIPQARAWIHLSPRLRPALASVLVAMKDTAVLRVLHPPSHITPPPPGMSPAEWTTVQRLAAFPTTVLASETEWFEPSAEQARASGTLGDRPLRVLAAGHSPPAWLELQAELARLSTRGRLAIVHDSGHMIPFEAPDAVVRAIEDVLRHTASF